MVVGVVELLKWLRTFTWEVVRNGAAKGAPVGHNMHDTSPFNGGKMEVREGKLTYLTGLPHRGCPLTLSYITPQPRCHLEPTTNIK
jgi:hypothetical protein